MHVTMNKTTNIVGAVCENLRDNAMRQAIRY